MNKRQTHSSKHPNPIVTEPSGKNIPHWKILRKRMRIHREKPDVWFFPKQDVGYIQIPKVATRSIRQAFEASSAGLTGESLSLDVLEKQFSKHITHDQIRPHVGNAFLFAFVRNPLTRLHSAYRDKIVNAERAGKANIFACHGMTFGMTFEQFVKRVAEIPDRSIDRHLRSQASFLTDKSGCLIPDFIGQLESFQEGWEAVREKVPSLHTVPHRNSSQTVDHSTAYSPEIKKIARIRYQKDFELFGYE